MPAPKGLSVGDTFIDLYTYQVDTVISDGNYTSHRISDVPNYDGGFYETPNPVVNLKRVIKNKYKGKKGVWFGDSIIDLFSIPETVAPLLGAVITNVGFQACCMAPKDTTTTGQSYFSMLELAKAISTGVWTNQNTLSTTTLTNLYNKLQALKAVDFSTVDFILISYGTNDFGYNAPIGDSSCQDTESTCGALNNAINYIEGKNANIEIIVTTPIWRGNPAPDAAGFDKTNRLEDYVYGIKQTCGARGIKCIDLFTRSGINDFNKTIMLNNTDILHPLAAGATSIVNAVVDCIQDGYIGVSVPYFFWDKDPLNLIHDHDSLWKHYHLNVAYVFGGVKYLSPIMVQQYKDAILSRKYYASIAQGAVITANMYFVCFNAGSGTIGRIDISIVSKADGSILQTTALACAYTATEVLKTATALTTTGVYTNCYIELHVKRMVAKSVTDFGIREPIIKITGA